MISSGSTFSSVVTGIGGLFDAVIAFLIALIVAFLIWRVVTAWVIGGGDPNEIERGKQSVYAGFIVLICVLGLWSIVLIVRQTFLG